MSSELRPKEEPLSNTNVRLQVLQEMMAAVHSTLDLEKVFKQITDSAVRSMDYTTALIMVLNEEKAHYEIKSISTKKHLLPQIDKILGFSLKNFSVPADRELNPHMESVISGRVVVTQDLADLGYPLISRRTCQAIQKLSGTKNGVLMPLKIEEGMVGALFVSSLKEEVSEEELTTLQNFAVAAAQAIRNARLHAQVIQAEEALRESESKFKNLFEHAKDAVIIADAQTGILVDVNSAACEMLSLPKDKIIGMHQSEIHPPELVEQYTKLFRDHVEKGIAVTEDLFVQRADGSRVPVDISANVIEIEGRRVIQGVFRDITGRKQIEEKQKTIIQTALDGFWLIDMKGRFLEVNDSYCKMIGYSREELLEMSIPDIEAVENPDETFQHIDKIMREGSDRFETKHRRKDGRITDVEISVNYLDIDQGQMFVFVRDISERKQVEDVLKSSKEFIENVFESVNDAIAIVDAKSYEIVAVNKAFLNALNVAEKDVIGKHCYEVTHGSNKPCEPPNDRCPLAETLRTGGFSSAEHIHHDKQGRELYIEVSTSPIRNEEGMIHQFIHITRDITERKLVEEEIRVNTEDLMMVNLLNDSINRGDSVQEVARLLSDETKKIFLGWGATVYLLSEDKEYLVLQSLGLPARVQSTIEKMIGSKLPEIKVRLEEEKLYSEVLKTGKPQLINDAETIQKYMAEFTEDNRIKRFVPSIFRILGIRSMINIPLISHGQVIGLLDISRKEPFTESDMKRLETIAPQITNIIERKRTEEQLRESEERYRTVIEGAHDMIQSVATDGRVMFANRAWRETLGYSNDEISTLNLFQIIHQDSLPHCQELFTKVMSGEAVHNIQATFLTKDGRSILVEGSATPRFIDDKVVATQAILRDITERKKIEEALQESRNFNSSLLENSPHAVVVINPDTSIRYVNPAWEEINGWTLEETVGMKAPYPWWPEEVREEMYTGFLEAMKQSVGQGEVISQKKNGERYWLAMKWTMVMHNDEFQYLLVNSIDITERKRIEDILRESEEKLQRIFESVNDGLTVTDLNGVILDVNERALQLSGFNDKDELIGRRSFDSIAVYDRERAIADMLQLAQQGGIGSAEYSLLRADGSEYPAEINASVLKDTNGNLTGFISAIRDITERKKAEEAIRESEGKFSTAFRSSPVSISITRLKDGAFVEINDSFTRDTGYTREEVIGRTSTEIGIWVNADDRSRMLQLLEERGRINNEEFEFRVKSNEIRTWLFSAERISIGGEPCISVMTVDITERKQAEEALEVERQNFRNSIDNSPLGIVVLNYSNQVIYCNQAYLDMYGYSSIVEFHTIPAEERFTEESIQKMGERLELRQAGEPVPSSYEVDIIRKDGEIRNMVVFHREIIWNGETQFQTLWQDVTESKQAEEALINEATRRRILIDGSRDGIVVLDQDGGVYEANQRFAEMLGYSSEEILKIHVWDWEFQFTREKVLDMVRTVDETGDHFETKHRRKDGTIYDVEISTNAAYFGGEKLIFCVCRDITENKKREQLQNHENYVLTLLGQGAELNELLDAIINLGESHDPSIKGSVLLYDPSRESLFQASSPNLPDEYIKLLELGLPIGPNVGSCGTAAYRRERVIVPDIENSPLFQPFEEAVVLATRFNLLACWSEPIISSSGDLLGTIANYSNKVGEPTSENLRVLEWSARIAAIAIERKRAEEALEVEQQNFRNSMDNSPLGIVILNDDNQILYCNQTTLDMYGYSQPEEFMNLSREERFTAESVLKLDERTERRKAGKPIPPSYEMDIVRKDGEIRNMMVFRRDVIWNGEKQFQTLWQDITERKKAQQQLIVTDRLASIGELASGVAHELNNPLTSVIGFSQLLLSKEVPDDIKEDITIICNEARRTAEIVKNLLTFARKHTPVKQLTNVNGIIEQVLQLRAYEQRVNNIRVSTQFATDLPEVMVDFFQLQQVFLNIIINAEHFMIEASGEGILTITTEKVEDVIKVTIADDGPGISKEDLGHLFDPFFTTKEVGKGTGLGLSICHGIITEHNGRIYAESELGKGATFVVELPLTTTH